MTCTLFKVDAVLIYKGVGGEQKCKTCLLDLTNWILTKMGQTFNGNFYTHIPVSYILK